MNSQLSEEERKKIYEEERVRIEAQKKILNEKKGEGLGYILLLIPVAAAVLMYFWVGSMNMLQSPGSTLTFLGVGTILLTAIIAAVEASQLGFGTGSKKESGPVSVFLGVALLWIIVYPYYFYLRSKKGKKNLIFGAIVVALVFAGAWYLLGDAINSRVDEIRNIFN